MRLALQLCWNISTTVHSPLFEDLVISYQEAEIMDKTHIAAIRELFMTLLLLKIWTSTLCPRKLQQKKRYYKLKREG